MGIRSIKGVITLTDGSTSEFLITESGWNQWNAEGWRDAKARLGETTSVLDAISHGIAELPDPFLDDEDEEDDQ